MLREEPQHRDGESERHRFVSQDGDKARAPLATRVALALYGLWFVALAFAPAGLMSELVWASLFAACVGWEMVGVLGERRWRQEPLTRLYRDRLMKLDRWGYLFRVGFLFLFCWWLAHWLVPGF